MRKPSKNIFLANKCHVKSCLFFAPNFEIKGKTKFASFSFIYLKGYFTTTQLTILGALISMTQKFQAKKLLEM